MGNSVAWARANFPPKPIAKSANVKEFEFNLDSVKGKVKITKTVTIPPSETVLIPGLTECNSHFKRVHVMTEAAEQFQHEAVRPVCAYSMFEPGSS